MQITASAVFVRALLELAKTASVDMDPALRQVDLPQDSLEDPDGRVPMTALMHLTQYLMESIGDPVLGLHLGEMGRWGSVPEYIAANSPTLGEAIGRTFPYLRLLSDNADVQVVTEEEVVRIQGPFPLERMPEAPPALARNDAEQWLAGIVCNYRNITGVYLRPREVRFAHPRPTDTSEHERIFGVPLKWGAQVSEVLFERRDMDLPIARADTALGRIIMGHAEELMKRLPGQASFRARVNRALVEALAGGDPGVEAIARKLGVSSRTLQRRLAEEGTSHQEILDATRKELALRYLAESMATAEVAILLGYSEARAFKRAFKRWTSITPAEWRRNRPSS